MDFRWNGNLFWKQTISEWKTKVANCPSKTLSLTIENRIDQKLQSTTENKRKFVSSTNEWEKSVASAPRGGLLGHALKAFVDDQSAYADITD